MRALLRGRSSVVVGVLTILVACESPTTPDDRSVATEAPREAPSEAPRFTISDAANGGRTGFNFLPPTVARTATLAGAFDGSFAPDVRICRWVANACAGDDIVLPSGTGPDHVIVEGESYSAVWTGTTNLTVGDVYRMRVYRSSSAVVALGFADLLVVTPSQSRNAVFGFINVVKGVPLVIRFRIDTTLGADATAPVAAGDGPTAASVPGDAYHGAFNSAFAVAAPGLLANDDLATPAATIASFGLLSNGLNEAVTTHAAGATVSLGASGSLQINADGSVTLTPPTGFTGYVVFGYRLTNPGGSSDAISSIAVGRRPATENDTYAPALVGNVPINTATSTQFSVLANDPADGMAAALVSATNGTATVAGDGKLTFTPDVNFSGEASITYRATNGFGDAPATATVSLTVGAPIWFVNANAGANGDGRFGTPFNCLTGTGCFDPVAADAANQTIFMYSGSYAGGLTLLSGQKLVGQGASASLSAIAGITWPADAGPEPTMGGAAPTISTAAANTNGLVVAGGNTLRGFTLGNATGIALAGAGFGTLAIADVGINTAGQALGLTNGTLSGSMSGVTSSGGAHNIYLANVATTGTFSLGAGALSGATGDAVVVTGGTGAFSYAGAISNSATLAVSVAGKTGGGVALSGDINPAGAAMGISVANNGGGSTITFSGGTKKIASGTATGVSLAANTGATVVFSGGGLAVTSTTGTGFAATDGGTVVVSGNNNSIASTGGVALAVDHTTIGASGLTFRSISANGGGNGIVLNATGASGGLTVTGDGTPASGGTIQNMTGTDGSTTGTGVRLDDTRGVSLSNMSLSNHANFAIYGNSVGNFSLDRVRITGTNGDNGAADEGAVVLTEVTGSGTISRSFISGGAKENVHVENAAATLTSLAFTQDTIQDNNSVTGGAGLAVLARGTGHLSVTVSSSLFRGNRAQAVSGDANATSALTLTVAGNTIVAGSANQGTKGIEVTATGDAEASYDVDGNKVGTDGALNQPLSNTGINIVADSRSTMTGKVRNNTVWSASSALGVNGIRVFLNDTATMHANVSGNTVGNVGSDYGLLVEASGADTQVPPAGTGTMDIAVMGNTVNVLPLALDAIRVQSRHNNRVCARISGNVSTSTANGFFGLLVRQANLSSFKIEGLSGRAGAYLAGLNPGVTDGVADNGGTFTAAPADSCNIP